MTTNLLDVAADSVTVWLPSPDAVVNMATSEDLTKVFTVVMVVLAVLTFSLVTTIWKIVRLADDVERLQDGLDDVQIGLEMEGRA